MHPCNVFTHNTQNFLLLLIHVQVQCDFAITRDTCVDVYSLNCLDLFLKYKIGQTCLVCVRVLDHECFAFFLLRDVFESLKFCLDLWLSSLLDCIHFCVFFLSLKNCFLSSSTTSRQIFDRLLSIETLVFLFSIDLIVSSIHRAIWNLSRQLLDRFSIHLESFYLANSCLISIEIQCSTDPQSIELRFI